MSLNHSPAIVTDGLVLCLDAANVRSYPKSGTTWTDLSTSGNNGTLYNQASYSSANAGVMDFDGTDDYIDVGSDIISGTNNNFTVSFWAVADSKPGTNQNTALWGWGSNGIGSNGLVCYIDAAQFSHRIAIQKNGGGEYVSGEYNVQTGVWFNFVYTFSSAGQFHYANGSFLASKAAGANPGSSGSFRVGSSLTGEKFDLNGRMNNVLFYSRALAADEVRRNYEATVGRYT